MKPEPLKCLKSILTSSATQKTIDQCYYSSVKLHVQNPQFTRNPASSSTADFDQYHSVNKMGGHGDKSEARRGGRAGSPRICLILMVGRPET